MLTATKQLITQTSSCDFYKLSSGCLFAYHKPDLYYTLDHAIDDVKTIRKYIQEEKYPLLVDMRDLQGISREAREYFAGDQVRDFIIAIALIVESATSRIIGNFFLSFNKLKVPVKLFNSDNKGETWLRGFISPEIRN
ncbi:MAG: hypothetical protein OEZ36_10770 [Spirochaetota bacterium]|nr:hypothetical protein [Spirochaetota bacterium]